jgi:tetratricopeptide (TPR) repeat protein
MQAEDLFHQAHECEADGNHSKAAAIYKQLVADSSDARFHVAYGACLQHLGHWEQSAAQLECGLALKPHYAEADARLMLAESYFRSGKKSKAVEQWRLVGDMSPTYPSYEAPINAARALLNEHA